MTWILLVMGSVVCFTTLNLLQRVLAVDSENPRAMSLIFNTIAAILALIIFFLTGAYKTFSFPTATFAWIALIIAALCYGSFERGRFLAAKLLDASALTIIMNISVLIAFVGSVFLYHESLSANKLIGCALIVGALLLVSVNKKALQSTKQGIIVAITISTMLGIGWALDKLGTQYFTASTYSILIWALPIIVIFVPYIKLEDIKSELKISSWKIFVLAAINVIGYLIYLMALESAEATRVIPITQTATLFTILFGIILLKEREYIPRKIVAGIMAVIGVFFLI